MQHDCPADAIAELMAVADAAMAAVEHGGIAAHDEPIWRNEDAVALRLAALADALHTLNLVAPQGGPNWPRALRAGLEDIQISVTETVAAWGWHGLLDVPEARAAWHHSRIGDWHERVERPLMEAAIALQDSARLASDLEEDVHDLAERGRALGYEPAPTTDPRQSFRSAELRYRSDLRLGAMPRASDRHDRDWKIILRTEAERIRGFAPSLAEARHDGPRPGEKWARSIAIRLDRFLDALEAHRLAARTATPDRVAKYRRTAFNRGQMLNGELGGSPWHCPTSALPSGWDVPSREAIARIAFAFDALMGNGPEGWGLRMLARGPDRSTTLSQSLEDGHLEACPRAFEYGYAAREAIASLEAALVVLRQRFAPAGHTVADSAGAPTQGETARRPPQAQRRVGATRLRDPDETQPDGRELLTLDDRATALWTRWLDERRLGMSKRMLARALGCHHSSLTDCVMFRRIYQASIAIVKRGFIDPRTGSLEAYQNDNMEEDEGD